MRGFVLSIVIVIALASGVSAYENSIYIWQRSWDDQVKDSIKETGVFSSNFAVLCGSYSFKNNHPQFEKVSVKWNYFKNGKTGLTATVRMDTGIASLLRDDESSGQLLEAVTVFLKDTIREASAQKIVINGVQIDYDCPTSKLSDYTKFLSSLKSALPGIDVSVTALPTWLESVDFQALAKASDYYVLQVHSFKVPDTLEEALKPFSGADTLGWVEKASRIRHPFYVSLPTYGYEVFFDENGRFIGLRAETSPVQMKPGMQRAIVATDPDKILDFTKHLTLAMPAGFKGVYWFRMPIRSDIFNWSMETFSAVVAGAVPHASLKAQIVSSEPGLFEIYLVNDGEKNIFRDVSFEVGSGSDQIPMHDIMAGYREELSGNSGTVRLSGPAPKTNDKKLVAWFRAGQKTINPLSVSEVQGYEK